MFNIEKITGLTVDEVIIINELLDVAKEAKNAAKLIRDTYQFPLGTDTIEVWSDETNYEYLTHAGTWQARYLHQEYDVDCSSEDSIFKYLRAEYLVENEFCEEYNGCYRTEEGKMAYISKYFRSFLVKTRKLYESNNAN